MSKSRMTYVSGFTYVPWQIFHDPKKDPTEH